VLTSAALQSGAHHREELAAQELEYMYRTTAFVEQSVDERSIDERSIKERRLRGDLRSRA